MGLYWCGRLVGVAVYSEPTNVRSIPAWTKNAYTRQEGIELGRFVLLDEVGYNAESHFFARSKRLVALHKPEVRVILAYSDPVARRDQFGGIIMPGHVGQIYQATNASYLGRSAARTQYLDPQGRVVSPRAMSKIVRQESGHRYARVMLEQASQTIQKSGEDAAQWLNRARASLTKLRHPGNHVYMWGMSRRDPAPKGLTAPKSIDPAQLTML